VYLVHDISFDDKFDTADYIFGICRAFFMTDSILVLFFGNMAYKNVEFATSGVMVFPLFYE
jgi:hypothetical protein